MAHPPKELDRILAALEKVRGPDANGWYTALCPFHNDREHPNLRLTEKGYCCLACGAKGSLRKLVQALGLAPDFSRIDSAIAATYDYRDEDGELLFQVVRKVPKAFTQRRPDGKGGWIRDLKGVRRVLYLLPELLSAGPEAFAFLCEGEKDADRLARLDLVATTNPGGAGKWRGEYAEALRGRRVVILPDSDDPGREHAEQVARSAHSVAAEVRLLELPGLPEKGDVSDWLDDGGTAEELLRLTESAPPWEPGAGAPPALPEIIVTDERLRDLAEEAWAALQCGDAPRFFKHGGLVAEIREDEGGRPKIVHLSRAAMRGRLDRCADWNRLTRDGKKPVTPPLEVVDDMLALPAGLPELLGLAGTPPVAPDGALIAEPGYQAATRLCYRPYGEPVPPVPEEPDSTDLQRAKQLIGQDWLGDFPFRDDASRANLVAAALTLLVRDLIGGPVPLQAVDAPAPGTGKTLLARSLGIVATGAEPPVRSMPRSEDEVRKQITAVLSDGRSVVLLDNIRQRLASQALAAALTSVAWSDRLLGTPHNVELPVRTLFVATGNNLDLDLEIARRAVWIRIDAMRDRPWERRNFRHADFIGWVVRHRHELVWALLVLVRHWFAVGLPAWSGAVLGSYEAWCATVGGILEAAGIGGFLGNREELYRAADAETEEWRAFVAWWWEEFGSEPVRSAELLPGAQQCASGVFERVRDGAGERALTARLGKALRARRDRRFGGFYLRHVGEEGHSKTQLWRLEEANEDDDLAGVEAEILRSPAQPPQENGAISDSFAGDAGDAGDDLRPRVQNETEKHPPIRGPDQPPHYPHSPHAGSHVASSDAGHVRGAAGREPCRGDCGALVPAGQKCAPCAEAAVDEWAEKRSGLRSQRGRQAVP